MESSAKSQGDAADEPFGTTALPGGALSLQFDDDKMGKAFFGNNMDGHVVAQQPQTQVLATYEASKNENLDPLISLNGSLIDVNPNFVLYALKNGLIRVLHRHSAMRALLRGHSGQIVTDISFFHDGDTVATVSNEASPSGKSTLIVWRVYECPPEIGAERLLEITNLEYGGAPDLTMARLVWHPFNPNQFWLTHSTSTNKQVATLVETTRIRTKVVRYRDPKDKSINPQEQHAACQWHSPYCVLENTIQLRDNSVSSSGTDGQLVDLCWSGRDVRNVLSVHKNGKIILWDLKAKQGAGTDGGDGNDPNADESSTILPKKLFVINDGEEHSRCMFLPHDQSVELHTNKALESVTTCFVTASATNSKITLWSAFAATKHSDQQKPRELVYPTKLQVLDIGPTANPSSFVLDLCFGPANVDGKPPSSFLMLGSRNTGRLYALRVKSEWSQTGETAEAKASKVPLCAGVDYMVPFSLKHPVYSWSVICGPTQDVTEDEDSGSGYDIKAFAYQSKAVQCLTVTSNMSLPPKNTGGIGSGVFAAESLAGLYVSSTSTSGSSPEVASNEPAYDEEDYDVDDDDDDGEGDAVANAAAAAVPPPAPATASGSHTLFPGAPNPFANWLGAIAGSTPAAPATEDTDDDDEVEEALPTPPAPSALPMPPGIVPPPGIVGPPPGLVPPVPAASTDDEEEELALNPLELLAKSMGGITVSGITNDTNTSGTQTKKSGAKKNKNKSPRRSRSPKAPQSTTKKGVNSNNKPVPNPFPDGVKILKRNEAPPPLPADPSVLSDPALLVAAGIPISPPVAAQPPVAASPAIDPAVIEEQVQKAVVAAVSSVVVPAIQKSVQETFAQMARPLHNSMDSLSRKGVSVDAEDLKAALDLETPLKVAFADNLRNVVVPSLQSISGQVVKQVQASMPKPPPPKNDESQKLLEALVQQIQGMASKLDSLTAEVSGLRKTVSDQAAAAAAQAEAAAAAAQGMRGSSGGSTSGNSNLAQNAQATSKQAQVEAEMAQIRNIVDVLLSKGKYEEAFTKAVAAPTPQMAVYCCARSDVRVVLSDNLVLSQLILLCLMQQLSAALMTTQSQQEMQIELAWLQEITLSMNPTDPTIIQHVPKVLRQLVANVNTRMGLEGTGPFRRPLQMLLNSLMGMQMALGK